MAYLVFAPPPASPSSAMKIDPSEASSSSYSTSTFGDGRYPPNSPEVAGILENHFYTPKLDRGSK